MSIKTPTYQYFAGPETMMNVSQYMINGSPSSSASNSRTLLDPHPHTASSKELCGTDPSQRHQRNGGRREASADFELNDVLWTDGIYTISQLISKFSLRFPVIVRTTNGYFGAGHELTTDQVLFIHRICLQNRVLATDARGRNLTLPTDCSLKVRCLTGSQRALDRSHQSLADVLRSTSLPVTVDIVDEVGKRHLLNEEENDDKDSTLSSENLRLNLKKISEERFLIASTITKGWLDQSNVRMIPEQLKGLSFRLAIGIKDALLEEWIDYCGMFHRASRHLRFILIDGYKGIIYDDWFNKRRPTSTIFTKLPSLICYKNEIETETHLPHENETETHRPHENETETHRPRENETETHRPHENETETVLKRPWIPNELPWQQNLLGQGSLPSLPSAINEGFVEFRLPYSGSASPSHLSSESLQPSRSTDSLLPRLSVDLGICERSRSRSGCDRGTPAAKRKSSVPSRLQRRKGDPRKQSVPCVVTSSLNIVTASRDVTFASLSNNGAASQSRDPYSSTMVEYTSSSSSASVVPEDWCIVPVSQITTRRNKEASGADLKSFRTTEVVPEVLAEMKPAINNGYQLEYQETNKQVAEPAAVRQDKSNRTNKDGETRNRENFVDDVNRKNARHGNRRAMTSDHRDVNSSSNSSAKDRNSYRDDAAMNGGKFATDCGEVGCDNRAYAFDPIDDGNCAPRSYLAGNNSYWNSNLKSGTKSNSVQVDVLKPKNFDSKGMRPKSKDAKPTRDNSQLTPPCECGTNDNRRSHRTSEDADKPVTCSPTYWSSDQYLETGARLAKCDVSEMKRRKAVARMTSTLVRNDGNRIGGAVADASLTIPSDRNNNNYDRKTNFSTYTSSSLSTFPLCLDFLDSTQSLFSSSVSMDLSTRQELFLTDPLRHGSHGPPSPYDLALPDGAFTRQVLPRRPFSGVEGFAIVAAPSRGHPLPPPPPLPSLGCAAKSLANRNRKQLQTNGRTAKMRLDLNGTAMSTGSELTDDGYNTKGSSSTSGSSGSRDKAASADKKRGQTTTASSSYSDNDSVYI